MTDKIESSEKCNRIYNPEHPNEIQDFLAKHVGRCKTCGHQLKKITTVHRTFIEPCGCERVIYHSGLTLTPTHWSITETDDDEPHGTGCTECEKGSGHRVMRDHVPYKGVYCRVS